jgi:hypothetical protein
MADDGDGAKTSDAIIRELESSGFFQQIGNLEKNLKAIAGDLQSLGETATQRLDETESLAAHVLAMEAILAVMLKSHPVDADAVRREVSRNTKALTGGDTGGNTVQLVVDSLLAHSQAPAQD